MEKTKEFIDLNILAKSGKRGVVVKTCLRYKPTISKQMNKKKTPNRLMVVVVVGIERTLFLLTRSILHI